MKDLARRLLLTALVACLGCGEKPAGSPPAVGVDPAPIVFTLNRDGSIQESSSAKMEDVRGWAHVEGLKAVTDPVEIRVPADASMGSLQDLLAALFRASRVNIGIRVEADLVHLPVAVDQGCNALLFYTGKSIYNEHSAMKDGERLWLQILPGAGGAMFVDAIQISKANPNDTLLMEEGDKSRRPTNGDFEWTESHPPLGLWDRETFRKFLSEERVAAYSPVCVLTLRSEDNVLDAMTCLAALQSVAASRVLANLMLEK